MVKNIKLSDRVVVTVKLTTEVALVADHTMTKPCCDIIVAATIDGEDAGGLGNMTYIDHPVAVAQIGRLYLTADNAAKVQSVLDDIETMDYVVAWREKEAQAAAADKDYESHCGVMRRAMTE